MKRPLVFFLLALCPLANLSAATERPGITHHNTGALPATLPFSEAVQVGDTYYLSGQIGILPGSMTLVEGGMPAEARQTLDNIQGTLQRLGLGLENVVKCTVMLEDMSDWPAFNGIYQSYFHAPYPARSAFGSSGLALGAKLELECIAVK